VEAFSLLHIVWIELALQLTGVTPQKKHTHAAGNGTPYWKRRFPQCTPGSATRNNVLWGGGGLHAANSVLCSYHKMKLLCLKETWAWNSSP